MCNKSLKMQEYTMVLQTMQQLRDVYGESVDKIVSSNTAVFIYLISNDMGMLEDLSKQAGNTHVSRASSKNIRKEVGTLYDSVEDDVSYTYSTEQEPLFSVDKLLNFTTGESMVLSSVHRQNNSGEAVRPNPIFNTDEMIMPMAYALHSKGHTNKMFSTSVGNAEVATSSSGQDVYQTIPDFTAMYEKRVKQARLSKQMRDAYQKENNFSDQDMIRQDVNIVSESIMRMINATLHEEEAKEKMKKNMEENAIADFEQYDESFGDEDESINEGLNDTERRIVNKGGFDANQRYGDPKDAIITNEKNKKHQDNISQQESKYQQQMQLQQQLIYLDNQASFSDLRNNDTIYNVLSEALYDAFNQVGSNSAINSNNPYQYEKLQNNHHVIKHTQTGDVLFDYWRIEENGQMSEFWEIQPSFRKLIVNTAQKEGINVSNNEQMQNVYMLNQNAVNQLFKVDESDIVYRELCSKIRDEFGNRGENANG